MAIPETDPVTTHAPIAKKKKKKLVQPRPEVEEHEPEVAKPAKTVPKSDLPPVVMQRGGTGAMPLDVDFFHG